MVEWLFKPKVQLGLLVNFAFVMFTLVSSFAGVPPSERESSVVVDLSPAVPYAPLPPPAMPSSVAAVELGGQLNVSLDNDLTLVKKINRALVLSPSFVTRARPVEPPANVTLRFTIFSDEEACPDACMLVINADGSRVFESAASGTFSTGWKREKVPGSTKFSGDQAIVTVDKETFTTQIPYATFVDIISARRVVLSFGPDKVELTHDQIESLRDMNRRVTPPPVDEQRESKFIKAF